MRLRMLTLIVLLTVTALASVQPLNASPCAIKVNVTPKLLNGRHTLTIVLTNLCTPALVIHEGDLPWASADSILLVIATSARGPALAPSLVLDDPSPALVTLHKGRPLTGSIDLDTRFPQLREVLKRGEVYLFWSYELRDTDSLQFERQFGGATLVE